MVKQYTSVERRLSPRPRSKRRREAGEGGGSGNITVVQSSGGSGTGAITGDGHTHPNKSALDKLGINGEGYVTVTEWKENEGGNLEKVTNKSKAGYADRAGSANTLDQNSPVWETIANNYLSKINDDIAQGRITFVQGLSSLATALFGLYRRNVVDENDQPLEDVGASIAPDGTGDFTNLFVRGMVRGNLTIENLLTAATIVFSNVLKSDGARSGFTDGKGIIMDALAGLIETDGLEVRGFMRIMELIINRLQLMESDYSFTEGGETEHIDYTNDHRLLLRMHKRHDNDYTPFYYGDIIYAKINDLLPRNATIPDGHTATKNGSYYTVYGKVDDVDLTTNTLTVSLYQSQTAGGTAVVPGGRNFTFYGTPIMGSDHPSVALATEMAIEVDGHTLGSTGFDKTIVITRGGNVADGIDPSTGLYDEHIHQRQLGRQQAWVLSATDKRLSFFWHVDQPVIRDDNYALCFGILPDLPNLPSTRDPQMPSLYVNTVFYEHMHHIYYPPQVVKTDRGEWVAAPTAEYTGPSGTYTPDGTLSQADQALVGSGGTFTKGQQLTEPYHCSGVTRNTWLINRLSPAWSYLNDADLLAKIRTEWHLDLETSRVWHFGALWECLTEGTAQEPWLTSSGWQLLSMGSVTLRIAISRRFVRQTDFANGQVGATLAFVLAIGGTDVSARIDRNQVEWTRQTKGADDDPALEAADLAWNQNHGYHQLEIPLTASDLPSNFWTEREAQFTCTVDTSANATPQTATITLH